MPQALLFFFVAGSTFSLTALAATAGFCFAHMPQCYDRPQQQYAKNQYFSHIFSPSQNEAGDLISDPCHYPSDHTLHQRNTDCHQSGIQFSFDSSHRSHTGRI